MASDEKRRRRTRPAGAGRICAFALLVVAIASGLVGATVRREATQEELLRQALEPAADAALTRPDERTRVEFRAGGYVLERGPLAVVSSRRDGRFLSGRTLPEARTAVGAARFAVATIRERTATTALPGTDIAPAELRFTPVGTPIDLVVAAAVVPPRLAVGLASSKRVVAGKPTKIAVRLTVTRPATTVATLRDSKQRRLHSWSMRADAGATVFELHLPARIGKPGTYWLTWVVRSGSEVVSRTITVTLVTPAAARARSTRDREVVLVGRTPAGDALTPGAGGVPRRITRTTGVDQAFEAIASSPRDVRVAVVDADAFGTRFVTDLRTVFPSVRVVAISREPATRALALRAGAVLALPRDVSARRLSKAVAALAAA